VQSSWAFQGRDLSLLLSRIALGRNLAVRTRNCFRPAEVMGLCSNPYSTTRGAARSARFACPAARDNSTCQHVPAGSRCKPPWERGLGCQWPGIPQRDSDRRASQTGFRASGAALHAVEAEEAGRVCPKVGLRCPRITGHSRARMG